MKVFVTGATGYVGFMVASAFRRAGHRVWGLARTEEKARRIERHELIPVVGDMKDPDSFVKVARECSVLVHAAIDFQADTAELDRRTVEVLLDAAEAGPQPKTVIYTSGVWVYGDTGGRLVDECDPLNPPAIVGHRPQVEQMVVKADGVRGLVIRPGCVYGKRGGLTGPWFQSADAGALAAIGDGATSWCMVQVDDLADGYLRAAESALSGEIFNMAEAHCPTVREMVEAVARGAGYKGKIRYVTVKEAAATAGRPLAEALAMGQRVDSSKAARSAILGSALSTRWSASTCYARASTFRNARWSPFWTPTRKASCAARPA